MTIIQRIKDNPTALFYAAVLMIYVNMAFHSGTLCGDECCAVNLAKMKVPEMCHWLLYDSYPIGWPMLMKVFCSVFGYSDFSIRLLGLIVQCLMLGAVAYYHRSFKIFPKVTFCCFLLLPAVINHTSSARAWGLGIATLIFFYTTFRLWMRGDGVQYFLASILTGILAVQSTYYNSVLVFAIVVADVLTTRDTIRNMRAMIVGVAAGLTMLPYLTIFARAGDHYKNLKVHYGLWDFVIKLAETATAGWSHPVVTAWVVIAILSAAVTGVLWHASGGKSCRFHPAVIALSLPCFFGFLWSLHYTTSPWYYLPLICLVCLSLDSIIENYPVKWMSAVTVIFLLELPPAYHASCEAQTNMGTIIGFVNKNAVDGDLIVLSPWHTGEMFNYYYRGRGELMAVPHIPVASMTVTRWDLESYFVNPFKEPETAFYRERIRQTISNHGTVYLVSTAEWRSRHFDAPSLEQLTNALPNQPMSFYHSFIMDWQLVNYVQSSTNMNFQLMENPKEECSPLAHYSLVILSPLK